MKFLYAVKGCSHCDSREYCENKNDPRTLSTVPKVIEERGRKWFSMCMNFFREFRVEK